MLGSCPAVSSPHQNKQTESHQECLRGKAQQRVDPVLYFFNCANLKTLVYSVPTKNEQTLNQHMFDACQTIRNRPWAVHDQTCP